MVFSLVPCICCLFTACNHGFGKDLPLNVKMDSGTKNLYDYDRPLEVHCFDDSVVNYYDYDEEHVNAVLTDFAVKMFQKNLEDTEHEKKNILISPTSIATALGMTSFGAKGDTLTQMEDVFGVSRGNLNRYNSEYLRKDSDEIKFANSIWFTNDKRLTVKNEFLQFNEETYGADLYETAFNDATVDAINQWVELNTDGMIQDVLDEIPQDAVMYLINALVFEAEWEEKYDSIQIRSERDFTTATGEKQKVDMMCSDEVLYLCDDNATGFVKYYKDKNYAFAALLPNESMDVYSYANTLTGEHLQNVLANPMMINVDVQIPQFSYEYDVEMSGIFADFGMIDAFDSDKADFSNMATSTRGNIYISRVLHKTFIEVTPVGTKAGAATVVEANDTGMGFVEQTKVVYLDRPFIYMIIDCENNQPVFIGAVNSVE